MSTSYRKLVYRQLVYRAFTMIRSHINDVMGGDLRSYAPPLT